MPRLLVLSAIALLPACARASAPRVDDVPPARVEARFSPHGGCTEAVVGAIDGARVAVRLQAYRLTSRPVIAALTRAAGRGVVVHAVLDRAEDGGPAHAALRRAGAHVAIDRAHPIAHDKVVIVDAALVETGSFNFTRQAESNAENCLILRDESIAAAYLRHFAEHAAHADPKPSPSPRP